MKQLLCLHVFCSTGGSETSKYDVKIIHMCNFTYLELVLPAECPLCEQLACSPAVKSKLHQEQLLGSNEHDRVVTVKRIWALWVCLWVRMPRRWNKEPSEMIVHLIILTCCSPCSLWHLLPSGCFVVTGPHAWQNTTTTNNCLGISII